MSNITTVFAYGTLRGDFQIIDKDKGISGDRWGVLQRHPKAYWKKGYIESGWELFQREGYGYPFAAAKPASVTNSESQSQRLYGTILFFPDSSGIKECDNIEGHDPDIAPESTKNLYMRAVVDVTSLTVNVDPSEDSKQLETTKAFLYHQKSPRDPVTGALPSNIRHFPDGDWLQGLKNIGIEPETGPESDSSEDCQ